MKPISVNTKLYFLLTHADGQVHKKEVEMGEKMLWHESLDRASFHEELEFLRTQDPEKLFEECLTELKHFNKNDQINCLAWMCLIANSDGFMDKNEWSLIYRLYHKHLNLELNEIMQRQKDLNKFISQYRNIPKVENNINIPIKDKDSAKSDTSYLL